MEADGQGVREVSTKSKSKAQKKSERLALEELSDDIEPLEPVKKREKKWLPKLGDVWKKDNAK